MSVAESNRLFATAFTSLYDELCSIHDDDDAVTSLTNKHAEMSYITFYNFLKSNAD